MESAFGLPSADVVERKTDPGDTHSGRGVKIQHAEGALGQ